MFVLRGGRLIDGTGRDPVVPAVVAVEGEHIVYAGPEETFTLPPNADVEDVAGKTIMPGLIDTHVHLGLGGEPEYLLTMVVESVPLAALRGARRARACLEAGFTTIRCMGDKGGFDLAVKQAVEEGTILGPRIVASGRYLTITGGHGDMFPDHVRAELAGRIVDGPDEARRAAREQIKAGCDNLKVMATGGGMSPGPATVAQLSVAEMAVVVEEARRAGKTTAAHAIGVDGIKNAILAGVQSIEHGTFADDEAIEMMAKHGCYLGATLSAFKTIKYGLQGGVPEYHVRKVMSFERSHLEAFRKAREAGVKITLATDCGTPFNYHGENAYELERMVELGMTAMEAIVAGTRTGAEAVGLGDKTGTLEPGKWADIIVLDGDPLQDIRVLQDRARIKLVIKAGNVLIRRP